MMDIAQNLAIDPEASRRSIEVGGVTLDGVAFLAPMSGVTDIGMRRAAKAFGAAMVVSEMVASDEYARGSREARLRAEGQGVDPHVVQLAGCDPRWMAEAARLAEASGAALIDINMGCPAKKVTGGYAGSALMRAPELALRLIEATVAAVKIPVTLKMRLGWDHDSLNAPHLARKAEDAGVRMVSVHGRTRQQFYNGRADWAAIRAVKQAVRVPVVANGDCASLEDAQAMLRASGADAVMVGRAALGQPWLVGAIARALRGAPAAAPNAAQRRDAALGHFESLLDALGAEHGLRHARKHLSAYAQHAGAPEKLRLALVTTSQAGQARRLLAEAFAA